MPKYKLVFVFALRLRASLNDPLKKTRAPLFIVLTKLPPIFLSLLKDPFFLFFNQSLKDHYIWDLECTSLLLFIWVPPPVILPICLLSILQLFCFSCSEFLQKISGGHVLSVPTFQPLLLPPVMNNTKSIKVGQHHQWWRSNLKSRWLTCKIAP